jgi:surfeit locus 1 family protein
MRRYVFPLILGLGGCAVLIGLGVWQVGRQAEKTALLAAIEARIGGAAEAIPDAAEAAADPAAMRYQPVELDGRTTGQELFVLSGKKGLGAGYEVIAAFETAEGRRVLLDRGFIPEDQGGAARAPVALAVTGNLHWPDEADSYTPAPDLTRNLWFARDVPSMAAHLGTEPILIVARDITGDAQGVEPVPLDTTGIPNDHTGYAITWFSLAVVWAGMTGYLLWRIRRKTI